MNDFINENTYWMKDMHEVVAMKSLDMNVVKMWAAFYDQHKHIHGSFRHLKATEYNQRMDERVDYIICQINATIESKLNYQKKYGLAENYAKQMGCL